MPQPGQSAGDVRDAGTELPVVDERYEIRVVEEVRELALDVPVVHIDRYRTQLEAAEHRLQVLAAVVQLEPDVVAGCDACIV